MKPFPLLLAASLLSLSVLAESTRFWELNSYFDFGRGSLEGLSLRSDGTLRLGPRFDLLQDTEASYLWDLAADSRGNVFVSTGSPGRIYKLPPNGPATLFLEKPDLEIHAITVDRQDRIYAAATPDGAVYRITPDGQSAVFYHPGTKYIWALAFDSKDRLYVATGDQGALYRVDPNGEGKLFFQSPETHIRALVIDRQDNVYGGTDENGMILRIRPDGQGAVLFESPKKEVTALALDSLGNLYAAAVGEKRMNPGQFIRPGTAPPAPPPPPVPQQAPRVPPTIATMNLSGGSEVYRIRPDGSSQRVWVSREDIVYCLAINSQGKLLLGTGNQGKIFEIEADGLYTYLGRSPSLQVTALLAGKQDVVVATSNAGRLYRLRPEFVSQGSFTSDVFDAGRSSRWGSPQAKQELPPETAVRFETRFGNSSNPGLSWSPWKDTHLGDSAASPGPSRARFLQWKVVLSSTRADRTPAASAVRIAYLPNNVAPVIEELQPTPPGYRVQTAPVVAQPQPQPRVLVLPPFGSPTPPPPVPARIPPSAQMIGEKAYVGVRWWAYDENDDTLTASLSIRGENEKEWKLLKDGISDMAYSWDSSSWPDGNYFVKVIVSDSPSNPPGEALSTSRESPAVEVDNTPPEILDLKCIAQGKRLAIRFRAKDRQNAIQTAEYSLDGSPWKTILPVTGLTDSSEEEYALESEEVSGSEHTVAVRVSDRFQNVAAGKVVCNPPSPSPR